MPDCQKKIITHFGVMIYDYFLPMPKKNIDIPAEDILKFISLFVPGLEFSKLETCSKLDCLRRNAFLKARFVGQSDRFGI